MRQDSEKQISYASETALEMRLLRSELRDAPKNKQRAAKMTSFLNYGVPL